MWAQLIKTHTKPGMQDAVSALMQDLDAAEPPGSGLVRSLAMQDQNDPSQVYMLVVFQSEEIARVREQDPARAEALAAMRAKMMDVFEGEPEFVDLTVLRELAP